MISGLPPQIETAVASAPTRPPKSACAGRSSLRTRGLLRLVFGRRVAQQLPGGFQVCSSAATAQSDARFSVKTGKGVLFPFKPDQ